MLLAEREGGESPADGFRDGRLPSNMAVSPRGSAASDEATWYLQHGSHCQNSAYEAAEHALMALNVIVLRRSKRGVNMDQMVSTELSNAG